MSAAHIASFDYIRGLAALMVVVHHIAGILSSEEKIGHWFWTGAAGVDIFFVLSGYLIYSILEKGSQVTSFLKNRAIRIMPTYVAISTVYLFLGIIALNRDVATEVQRYVLSITFIPHENHLGEIQPIVGAGWTLTYEAWFYALAALCFIKGSHRTTIFWSIPPLLALLSATDSKGTVHEFLTNQVIFEFWLGAIAKLIRDRFAISTTGAYALGATGIALLILDQVFAAHTSVGRFFVWGLPAFLLLLGASFLKLRTTSISTLMASTSYPVYLIHTIFVIGASRFIKSHANPLSATEQALVFVAILLLSYITAHLFEKHIERPIIRRLKNTRSKAYSEG